MLTPYFVVKFSAIQLNCVYNPKMSGEGYTFSYTLYRVKKLNLDLVKKYPNE